MQKISLDSLHQLSRGLDLLVSAQMSRCELNETSDMTPVGVERGYQAMIGRSDDNARGCSAYPVGNMVRRRGVSSAGDLPLESAIFVCRTDDMGVAHTLPMPGMHLKLA